MSFITPANVMVNARAYGDADRDGVPELQFCEPATGDLVGVDVRGKEVTRARGAVQGYATVPVAADVDGDGRCEIAVVNSRREVELSLASTR